MRSAPFPGALAVTVHDPAERTYRLTPLSTQGPLAAKETGDPDVVEAKIVLTKADIFCADKSICAGTRAA